MKVIKNVLPEAMAEELRSEFIAHRFDEIHWQHEQGFYVRKKISGPGLPGEDEPYSARFRKDVGKFCAPYFLQILPILEAEIGKINDAQVMAYRMGTLDHFRIHTDDYLGRGFILYLSKGWKWDWGGLLMVHENGGMTPNLPEFNSLAIIPQGAEHFVSEVSALAKEPRYAMVGFAS